MPIFSNFCKIMNTTDDYKSMGKALNLQLIINSKTKI